MELWHLKKSYVIFLTKGQILKLAGPGSVTDGHLWYAAW